METIDIILVSFHGRSKFEQGTSSPDLTYTPLLSNNHELALHQFGGCLPWPDVSMGVEPCLPHDLSLSYKALQEEEGKMTTHD
jgi:hypothetical protein